MNGNKSTIAYAENKGDFQHSVKLSVPPMSAGASHVVGLASRTECVLHEP